MNIRIALASILALLLFSTGAILFWNHSRSQPVIEISMFDKDMPSRTELHPGEIIRDVEYFPDGVRKAARASHQGGAISEYHYWPETGNLRSARTWLPASEGSEEIVLIEAEMEPDGVTYRKFRQSYLDGTVYQEMELLPDSRTRRAFYHPDGTVHREQILSKAPPVVRFNQPPQPQPWLIAKEEVHREDGSLAERFERGERSAYTKETFSAEGNLSERTSLNQWGGLFIRERFNASGTGPIEVLRQDYSGTKLTTFSEDGKTIRYVEISGPVDSGWTKVTYHDKDGNPDYRQQWAWNYSTGSHYLWNVQELNEDGTLKRTIYFHDKTTVPQRETLHTAGSEWGGPRTERYYDSSGRLIRIVEFDVRNQKVSEEEIPGDENAENDAEPIIAPYRLQPLELEKLPQIVAYTPSDYY